MAEDQTSPDDAGFDDEDEDFEFIKKEEAEESAKLVLDLKGFEGPLDVLLELARKQKVDLAQISILQLAEQYLVFVAEARRQNLELAADYLVMAAWLAYLKSRLLLPPDETDEEEISPEAMAARLAFQLERLEFIRKQAEALWERPQMQRDQFSRGMPEGVGQISRPLFKASLYDLMKAYADQKVRQTETRLTVMRRTSYSVEDALKLLRGVIGEVVDWSALQQFLPKEEMDPFERRAAVAATLVASLEMAKHGLLEIEQHGTYEPIFLRSPLKNRDE